LTNTDQGLRDGWLGVYSGYWNTSGGWSAVGTNGYYWSSIIINATNARYLGFGASNVNPSSNFVNKATGFSVRCVR
jgi:uncharacterized protein (TIGR02145 family)